MTADLTNVSGIELTMKFDFLGITRHIGNLYIPDTGALDWSLIGVTQTFADQWNSSDLAAAMVTDCTLVEIVGRVRGRVDAGVTHTVTMDIQGTVVANTTPAWFVHGIRQIPDNTARLVLVPGTSIFQKGRISMPGVPVTFVDGNQATSAGLAAYALLFPYFMTIDASLSPTASPAFSLAMTRVVGGVVQAKANVLSLQNGDFGTQLTARQ